MATFAKFDKSGKLVFTTSGIGTDTEGLIRIPDNTDPNSLFLYEGKTVGARMRAIIDSDRTRIVADGKDCATIQGFMTGATLLINGEEIHTTSHLHELRSEQEGVILIDITGCYFAREPISVLVISREQADAEVRAGRDSLLAASDWTQLPDNALSEEKKVEWATYRQTLRDITQAQPNRTTDTIEWPKKP